MSGSTRGIANFEKHMDKAIYVRFSNGREVQGVLKGFDAMANLVLDDCVEFVRDPSDFSLRLAHPSDGRDMVRDLGIVVCRGTAVTYVCPVVGMGEIENPFLMAAAAAAEGDIGDEGEEEDGNAAGQQEATM